MGCMAHGTATLTHWPCEKSCEEQNIAFQKIHDLVVLLNDSAGGS
jgi:hypothetical protein